MRENKGFTLIELLAVIVILAIIALIATPVIMNIINNSRQSAAEQSAKLMIAELRLAYNQAYLDAGGIDPSAAQVVAAFDMDGATATVSSGKVVVTDEFDDTCTMESGKAIVCAKGTNGKLKATINGSETFTFAVASPAV